MSKKLHHKPKPEIPLFYGYSRDKAIHNIAKAAQLLMVDYEDFDIPEQCPVVTLELPGAHLDVRAEYGLLSTTSSILEKIAARQDVRVYQSFKPARKWSYENLGLSIFSGQYKDDGYMGIRLDDDQWNLEGNLKTFFQGKMIFLYRQLSPGLNMEENLRINSYSAAITCDLPFDFCSMRLAFGQSPVGAPIHKMSFYRYGFISSPIKNLIENGTKSF